MLSFQGEKGAKGDPGPMGLPVSIYNKIISFHFIYLITL
jgi:hypothetical protein